MSIPKKPEGAADERLHLLQSFGHVSSFLREGVLSGGYKNNVPMVYAPVGESLEGESACSVANSGAMAPRLRNVADWRRRFKA